MVKRRFLYIAITSTLLISLQIVGCSISQKDYNTEKYSRIAQMPPAKFGLNVSITTGEPNPEVMQTYVYGAQVTGSSGYTIVSYYWQCDWCGLFLYQPSGSGPQRSCLKYSSDTSDSEQVKFDDFFAPRTDRIYVDVTYKDSQGIENHIYATKDLNVYGICGTLKISGIASILQCTQPNTQYSIVDYCNCYPLPGLCNGNDYGFQWTLPTGWTFVGTQSGTTITAKPDVLHGGNITCKVIRKGSYSKSTSLLVNRPDPNQFVNGNPTICLSDLSNAYSISSGYSLNGIFNWTSSNTAWKINGMPGSYTGPLTSVIITAPAIVGSSTTITVGGGNLCYSITKNISVIDLSTPTAPTFNSYLCDPSIYDPICLGLDMTLVINPVANATSYNWSCVPDGYGAVANGYDLYVDGTEAFVTFGHQGHYKINVSASNQCKTGPIRSIVIRAIWEPGTCGHVHPD